MANRPLTSSAFPAVLAEWRVDRGAAQTQSGKTQLVVLVLRDLEGRETCVAISKADAFVIGMELQHAARDAQTVQT